MDMCLKDYLRSRFARPRLPCLPLEELPAALLDSLPRRLSHTLGVVRLATSLCEQLGVDQDLSETLLLAARFHDVGYSPKVTVTGLHSVDGAALLAHLDVAQEAVEAVFWHGGAAAEATAKGSCCDIYENFEPPNGLVLQLLNYADDRTSPDGEMVTLRQRVLEIRQRYGPDHVFSRDALSELPRKINSAENILAKIARRAPNPLPWLVIDVDSTLVAPGEVLSTQTVSALAEYCEAGGRLSLATGKHPAALATTLRPCRLPGPHIAANGAVLLDGERVVRIGGLGGASAAIAEALQGQEVPFVIYTEEGIFVASDAVTSGHLQTLGRIGEPTEALLASPPPAGAVLKILCFVLDTDLSAEQDLRALAGAWPGICCVRTAGTFLEFCEAGTNKGTAMQRIFRSHSWPALHCHAIGDSENDLGMLQVAGKAVAVSDARPEILQLVDEVIEPPARHGVASHIRKLLDTRED